ncbi:MAG: PHP domain-containing protein [Deltaproteobacteria bacterium]|nr:PHP domain-containing protein [Deltaproteobacteria bacterium]MBW2085902.1 PHP domain-containing protein [Deltaproteobacteria bacterium]
MRVDLHIHTSPRSLCSHIDPPDLIQEVKRLGLDGFCLTEHQVIWDPHEVDELARDEGIKIFRGNEITTNQGDILVFGYEEDLQGVVPIKVLHNKVREANGFMIAAHPFRGFKTFGIGQLKMNVDQACKRKVFQYIDSIEVRNGKLNEQENDMASQVAERLGLPGTAGSDAHNLDEVGKWITVFERDVQNEQELMEELRAGRFTIGSAR